MIVARETTIHCDRLTPDPCDIYATVPLGVESARAELVGKGWSHRDGRDFCPEHAQVFNDGL